MALLFTLIVGAPLWWLATGVVDTRVTVGRGGPFVYLAVWAFVLALVLLARCAPAGPLPRGLRSPVLRAVLVATPIIFVLGLAFDSLPSLRPGPVWMAATVVAFLALPLALLTVVLARRSSLAGRGSLPPATSTSPGSPTPRTPRSGPIRSVDVVAAFLPLAAPALAILCLGHTAVSSEWEAHTIPAGRAGILYYATLPLWLPAALPVAYGIDRLEGSTPPRAARWVAGLSAALLAAAVVLLPALLWWAQDGGGAFPGQARSHAHWCGFASGVARWHPFNTSTHGSNEAWAMSRLPLDSLFHGAAAMMLAASLVTAVALAGIGRGRLLLTLPVTGFALLAQVAVTMLCVPENGPAAAPWIAACTTAALTLLMAVAALRAPARGTI